MLLTYAYGNNKISEKSLTINACFSINIMFEWKLPLMTGVPRNINLNSSVLYLAMQF